MKAILTAVLIMVFGIISAKAQSPDEYEYLQTAYEHLKNGNIEKAQNAYSVYCGLTNLRDMSFERQMNDMTKNDWKTQCYLIEYSDSTVLAVQRTDSLGQVTSSVAKNMANGSRLGNFSDWRLPGFDEMNVIATNLLSKDSIHNSYWFIELRENKNNVICKVYENFEEKEHAQEQRHNFFVIRHFYKNDEKKTKALPIWSTMTVTGTIIRKSR